MCCQKTKTATRTEIIAVIRTPPAATSLALPMRSLLSRETSSARNYKAVLSASAIQTNPIQSRMLTHSHRLR